jgi:hypothetical protein
VEDNLAALRILEEEARARGSGVGRTTIHGTNHEPIQSRAGQLPQRNHYADDRLEQRDYRSANPWPTYDRHGPLDRSIGRWMEHNEPTFCTGSDE